MIEQRTIEWMQERCGRATGSRFNDIMSKTRSGYSASRKNYMAEIVIQRLTNQMPETYKSAAMQFGIDYEDTARLAYTLETSNDVEETGFWKHPEMMAGASPDGLVNHDGLLEIKVPNTATHLETLSTRNVPRQYVPQVQGQLWITGRKWCDFVSFDPRLPENAQMIILRVERDDEYISELEDEVRAFLQDVDKQVEFIRNYGKGK